MLSNVKWEIYELINNKVNNVDSIHVSVFGDELILNMDNGQKIKITLVKEGKSHGKVS